MTATQDEDFDYEDLERMLAEEPFDPRTDPFYSHPEDVRDPDPPGTPDEDEDWLASVPPEVRDDFLSDPFTGAGETFAAGFLHHDGGRRGTGFAAGGILDQMDAGPLLAQFVQAFGTNHRQMAQLGESELIGLLYGAERMISWGYAQRGEVITALALRRATQSAELKNKHLLEHVDGEIAAALHISHRAATRLLDHCGLLRRLPDVRAAQLRGRITWEKAEIFADELAGLTAEQAQEIAARVLPEAEGMTPERLRRLLRLLVEQADPDASRERRKKARKDTGVHLWTEPSGNCGLAGRELDPALARAADARLTAQALWLAGQGMDGTLDKLRAAAFLANQNGIPLSALLSTADDSDQPNAAAPTGTGSSASDADARPDGTGPDSTAPSGKSGSTGPDGTAQGARPGSASTGLGGSDPSDSTADALRDSVPITEAPPGPAVTGIINLTMPISAHAYLTDRPGEIAGSGPADADTCRDLARWMARDPATRWCLTLVDPDGRAVAHACAKQAPPIPETPPSAKTPPGPIAPSEPGGNSEPHQPHPPTGQRRPHRSDKSNEPRGPNRPRGPNGSPESPEARATDPPGPRPDSAGPRGPWAQAPGLGLLAGWLAGLRLEFLAQGDCSHQRESPGYRPPGRLRHLIITRQRTCAEPGCLRPAQQCDIDHTVPYDQGGRTCECDLGPLCRHGHQAKQAPGWHLKQPEPGVMVWTMPSGRTYVTRPEPYPF